MGKLIQINVEFLIEKVSSPAADLSPNCLTSLDIEILGKKASTTEIPLDFPLLFNQRITFKRTYKNATILRAVEQLYRDRMAIRLLRRGPNETEGQVVARFDDSTGNSLLNGNDDPCSVASQIEGQSLELRTCVEGFCFRPRLVFQSFLNIRETAEKPLECSQTKNTNTCDNFCANQNTELHNDQNGVPEYQAMVKRMEACANRLHSEILQDKSHNDIQPNQRSGAGDRNQTSDEEGALNKTRPPFVVRHVDGKLCNRIPKLHKTMSQETDQMLAHFQMDHPSDTAIQNVQPGNVPVKTYWKLRREYEKKHKRHQQPPDGVGNVKGNMLPKLKVIRESPENYNSDGTRKDTNAEKQKRLLSEKIQMDKSSLDSSEGVSLDGRGHTLADVKQFIRQTTQTYQADKADHQPGCPVRQKPAKNVIGAGDETEMAAIYRDFAKTLHRDRMEKMGCEQKPNENARAPSPCSVKSADVSKSSVRKEHRRCKTAGASFTMERDILVCSAYDK